MRLGTAGSGWSASLTTLLVATLLVAAPSTSVAAGHAGHVGTARIAPQCFGKPATIVGRPGRNLRGTARADVIVTNGSASVRAGRGADLVCITGAASTTVDAGNGDDRVVNQTGRRSRVALGTGHDWFRGGAGSESVEASDGGDWIHLGRGTDFLRLFLDGPRASTLNGGRGVDVVQPHVSSTLPGPVVVDAAHHRLRVGRSAAVRSLVQFEKYELLDMSRKTSFLGSDAGESLLIEGRIGPVRLGGGDDDVLLIATGLSVSGTVRGGTGSDTLSLDVYYEGGDISADLSSGVVRAAIENRTERFTVDGFDDLDLGGGTVDVVGTASDNDIRARACRGSIATSGGNDVIRIETPTEDDEIFCEGATGYSLDGGAGDDAVAGGLLDDVLIGGAGTDTADGSEGADQCEAETVENCEPAP